MPMARRRTDRPSNKDLYELIVAQDARLNRLETRINYLFGGLAVLITLANLVGPEVVKALFNINQDRLCLSDYCYCQPVYLLSIGVGRIPLAARETVEQRKARIRARLAEDQKPTHPILAPAPEPEPTTEQSNAADSNEKSSGSSSRPSIKTPSSRGIGQRVVERRQSRPANYKIHVVTALGLALVVRVLALGPKAAFGGK